MIDTASLDFLLDGVEGYLHPDEPAFLAALASQVPAGQTIVEIGSYRGRSTIALAYGAHDGVLVFAVDPHEEHEVQGLPFGGIDNQHFMSNVSRAGMGHKIRAINLPSMFGVFDVENYAVDEQNKSNVGLVFIDGAHEYDAVSQDVQYWGHSLKINGILALHDSNGTWDGPTRVANELVTSPVWREETCVGFTRTFRKVSA